MIPSSVPETRASPGSGHRLIHDPAGLNTAVWPIPADQLITPVDQFFTRSHAPVPEIDGTTWRLIVDGLVERAASFSLEDLRRFPLAHIRATMVCAGLRRNEFLSLGPLASELPWGPEPVSTGHWTGFRLGDVLRAVEVDPLAQHVEFIGLDDVERQGKRFGFGGSIPIAKALAEEVLLATELNGQPLPPAHGYPLRVVVPGWIGARSVKWLGRITLRRYSSANYFQSQAYRLERTINPEDPRDVSGGSVLTEIPLNAVIIHPAPGAVLPAGGVRVSGWAVGSGGRPVTGVAISSNGGHDWIPAAITRTGSTWTWSLWEASVSLPHGRHTLMARATDTSGTQQPSSLSATWNVKGYNNNAWHSSTIDLV
jgi:sulfite oxidase